MSQDLDTLKKKHSEEGKKEVLEIYNVVEEMKKTQDSGYKIKFEDLSWKRIEKIRKLEDQSKISSICLMNSKENRGKK